MACRQKHSAVSNLYHIDKTGVIDRCTYYDSIRPMEGSWGRPVDRNTAQSPTYTTYKERELLISLRTVTQFRPCRASGVWPVGGNTGQSPTYITYTGQELLISLRTVTQFGVCRANGGDIEVGWPVDGNTAVSNLYHTPISLCTLTQINPKRANL